MNILFFNHLVMEFPEIIDPLKQQYRNYEFIFAESRESYRAALPECEVLIAANPSADDIEAAPHLKLLIIPFTGTAHVDLKLFQSRGIMVANAPGNGPIVAERAVALAMAVCGRVVEFHNDMGKGNWHRTGNPHEPFDYWYSMLGRNVSILGTGDIGRGIAKLLQGFGCTILGFRRNCEVPMYFSAVTDNLTEALSFGDIVFVALPESPETKQLIHAGNIGLLSRSVLINVGRGDVVEEQALYDSLTAPDGLRGAGLDVWYLYPSREHPEATGSRLPFHTLRNVVMSPHAGSHAPEGKQGQLEGVAKALSSYLETGVPITLVPQR